MSLFLSPYLSIMIHIKQHGRLQKPLHKRVTPAEIRVTRGVNLPSPIEDSISFIDEDEEDEQGHVITKRGGDRHDNVRARVLDKHYARYRRKVYLFTHTHARTHARTRICIHTLTNTCTYTRIHKSTREHIHICNMLLIHLLTN